MGRLTEGYRLHLIRMNGEALHMQYVRALRLLEPDPRVDAGLRLCQSKLEHIGRCRARLAGLSALCERLLSRARSAHRRLLQVSCLTACALERSIAARMAPKGRSAAPKGRSVTARKLARNNGWNMRRASPAEVSR